MAVHQEVTPKPKVMRPVSETRKVRKPLMERKRRERINNCLEQLALLLKEAKLVAQDKPVSKLEKADILELTVRHLQSVCPIVGQRGKGDKAEDCSDSHHDKFNTQQQLEVSAEEQVCLRNTDIKNELQPILTAKAVVTTGKPNDNTSKIFKDQETLMFASLEGNTLDNKKLNEAKSNLADVAACQVDSERSYMEGFHKCLTEVNQATKDAGEIGGIRKRLMEHLESCMHSIALKHPSEKQKLTNSKGIKRECSDSFTHGKKKKTKIDQKTEIIEKESVTPGTGTNPGLTLLPMRLADGGVAFLVQGDTKLLVADRGTNELPTKNATASPTCNSSFSCEPIHSVNSMAPLKTTFSNKVCIPAVSGRTQYFPVKRINKSVANDSPCNLAQGQQSKQNKYASASSSSSSGSITLPQYSVIRPFSSKDGPHYSISISENFANNGPVKVFPKVKTVTLPIGIVESTLLPSVAATKLTPEIKTHLSTVSKVCQDPVSTICPVVSQVALSCSSTSRSTNSLSSTVSVSKASNTINYVHILARPVVSTNTASSISILNNSKLTQTTPISAHNCNLYDLRSDTDNSPVIFQPSDLLQCTIADSVKPVYTSVANPSSIVSNSNQTSLLVTPSSQIISPVYNAKPNTVLTVFPPTPPPSVDQFHPVSPAPDSYSVPSLQSTDFNSVAPLPFFSNPTFSVATSALSANMPLYSNNTTSLSLLSTSVQLLSEPHYFNRRFDDKDEDEFIDVENVSKEDNSESNTSTVNQCSEQGNKVDAAFENKNEEMGDMWRPW